MALNTHIPDVLSMSITGHGVSYFQFDIHEFFGGKILDTYDRFARGAEHDPLMAEELRGELMM